VSGLFAYERGAPQLGAIRNEPDAHENVAEAGHAVEASLDALITAALEPYSPTPADRAVVRAMIDLGTWQALRDQGLGRADAVAAVSGMLATRLQGAARQRRGTTSSRRYEADGRGGAGGPGP
jgi:hypothetical protein